MTESADLEVRLLVPGTTFHGRYEIMRCLRAGGMGAVYEVLHFETKRRRALKTMAPSLVSDPDMRERFRLEATVAAEIESEHIVEVFDAGVDDETSLPFLVMELLKGETLAGRLERQGKLPAAEVVLLLHQASLALDRTHDAGIVHRDLKPDNLFVSRRDDGAPRLKVLDFGLAKVVAETTDAETTRSFGTPLYMSPEQIRGDGDIGPGADLYSLGQIAFALLTGHAYFEPESRRGSGVYALLVKVMEGAREAASKRALAFGVTLPEPFDAWFARATALEASQRFDAASELVAELAEVLGVEPPQRTGEGARPGVSPTVRTTVAELPSHSSTGAVSSESRIRSVRRSRGRTLGLIALAVTASGAVFAWSRWSTESQRSGASEVPVPSVSPPASPSSGIPAPVSAGTPVGAGATSARSIEQEPRAGEVRSPQRTPASHVPSRPKAKSSASAAPAAHRAERSPSYDPSDVR